MLASEEISDVPCTIVVEATGRRITVELVDGATCCGHMVNFDMGTGNVELADVKCQAKDSSLSIAERIFLRGDRVRMIHLPVEMQKAPLLDWRHEHVQQLLKKSLKTKRRSSSKKAPKDEEEALKRQREKKLRKLR